MMATPQNSMSLGLLAMYATPVITAIPIAQQKLCPVMMTDRADEPASSAPTSKLTLFRTDIGHG